MPRTTVQPEVIVLTGKAGRAQQIRQALQSQGVRTTQAASLDECQGRFDPSRPQLLILDSATANLKWQQAWSVAQMAGVPMIAIVERFDSRRWVELFKAGVLDVLSDPIPAHRLRMAVQDTFYGGGEHEGDETNWAGRVINGVRGWLGL